MLNIGTVLRSVTTEDSRLGFYTKETRDSIPDSSGCYAWFLPLWFYRDDLDELMRIVGELLHYRSEDAKEAVADFTWESVLLNVRHRVEARPTQTLRSTWQRAMSDERSREALQGTLLEASLLMPPLYVGRSESLKRRYLEHTDDARSTRNDFRARFRDCVEKLQLKIGVSDLIFACIRTDGEMRAAFDDPDLESLVEQIMMQFCRPPFSLK